MSENEQDILMSRLVDGEASLADWNAFRRLALADPALWQSLAEAQRHQAELVVAMGPALACADLVDLPMQDVAVDQFRRRLGSAATWGGWAAAAAVGLAWLGGVAGPTGLRQPYGSAGGDGTGTPIALIPGTEAAPEHSAGLGGPIQSGLEAVLGEGAPVRTAALEPDEALQAYIDAGTRTGRVVREMPGKIVLEARALPGGEGFEVIYLRPILERALVQNVYEWGTDDTGRATPVRVSAPIVPDGPM